MNPLLLAATALVSTNVVWHDAARDRDIPAKIYAPAKVTQPRPLIVFSHGLGGTREGYGYLAQHWATNGYLCVVVQHPGSDDAAWHGQTDKLASMRAAANATNALLRPQDVSFVITQMLRDPRVNTNAIGVAGHSFGAQTTLVVAGQRLAGQSFADARVKAAIPMSSPRPFSGQAFHDVRLPCLHLTGTKDDSPLFHLAAADRRFAYDNCPGPGQWLIILNGANHMTFAGRGEPAHLELICALTTKFWDAFLNGDKAAVEGLKGVGLKKLLPAGTVVEQK